MGIVSLIGEVVALEVRILDSKGGEVLTEEAMGVDRSYAGYASKGAQVYRGNLEQRGPGA